MELQEVVSAKPVTRVIFGDPTEGHVVMTLDAVVLCFTIFISALIFSK
jgi:hypothetical protein